MPSTTMPGTSARVPQLASTKRQHVHARGEEGRAGADDDLRPEPLVERSRTNDVAAKTPSSAAARARPRAPSSAEHLRHELRQVEERGEEDGRHQQHRRRTRRRRPGCRARRRDQGLSPGAPLDEHEGRQRDGRQTNSTRSRGIGPAVVGPWSSASRSDSERRRTASRRRGSRSGRSSARARRRRRRLPGHEDREGRDRQVEEEDPAPAEGLGEDAADAAARPRCRTPAAPRIRPPARPCLALRAAARRSCRGSPATSSRRRCPSAPRAREQHPDVRRHAADRGEQREDRGADEEDARAGRTCRRAGRR